MQLVMFLGLWSAAAITSGGGTASPETDNTSTQTPFGDLIDFGERFEIRSAEDELLELNPEPIFNWVDPTRNAGQKGCVFLWSHDGRPQAIGSVFTAGNETKVQLRHELHSLASGSLSAIYQDRLIWTPPFSGINWMDFTEIALPNENKRLRLTQMRVLARRFVATLERPDETQSRLELKPNPLYRYESAESGVLDGALFSFSLGTAPEVLMLVEAYQQEGRSAAWRFAFIRFHYWKMFVANEHGEVVWSADPRLRLVTNTIEQDWAREFPYISYMAEERDRDP